MKGVKIVNGQSVRVNGQLVIISGLDYYRQRIGLALKMHSGENIWFPKAGINWMAIFQSSVSEERILREIKRIIKMDPETVSINSLSVTNLDREKRTMSISYSVTSIYGEIKSGVTI